MKVMRKCLVVGMPKARARPAPNSYLQAVTVAMASGQVESLVGTDCAMG